MSGPLNENQFENVTQIFRDSAEQGAKRVVVNLADVPWIDSRGLAALIVGYKIFGGQPENFRLAALQDQPRLVFELTGFDNIFQIFESATQAAELEPNLRLEFLPGFPVPVPRLVKVDLAG